MATPSTSAASPLRDLARRPLTTPTAQESCDLCAEPLPGEHRHLLDRDGGSVLCACRACTLLFDRQDAGGHHYRLLPQRRQHLAGHDIDDLLWASLGIPVGLAFFTPHQESQEVSVGYPSPLGVTRSTVEPAVWKEVAHGHPALTDLTADVEALLVHRAQGTREHWIVPLDDCYRLAAVVRTHWKGLAGGPAVWAHVAQFFATLAQSADDQ